MDEEIKELKEMVEETLELSKENNAMLGRLRRSQKNAQMLRGLYWVFAIALAFGAYQYLSPYLKKIIDVYNTASSGITSITTFGNNLKTPSQNSPQQ